jgi:hypothetical protein
VPSLSYTINRGKHQGFFQSTPAFLPHHTHTHKKNRRKRRKRKKRKKKKVYTL